MLQECAVVLPRNWDLARHRDFDTIFTWHPDLARREGYVRAGFSQRIEPGPVDGWSARGRFLCAIAANKRSFHPDELYSRRLAAIAWCERHHPDHFDLFGPGWDRLVPPGPRWIRGAWSRIPALPSLLAPGRPSWRGLAASKRECLLSSRFNLCFENAQRIPGYITEKIFDAFMAGCVPVYWGAPDITEHIPGDLFVDFRECSGFHDMWRRLELMDEREYRRRQGLIRDFLSGSGAKPFDAAHVAGLLASHLTGTGSVRG
jgi:hypothetical protein